MTYLVEWRPMPSRSWSFLANLIRTIIFWCARMLFSFDFPLFERCVGSVEPCTDPHWGDGFVGGKWNPLMLLLFLLVCLLLDTGLFGLVVVGGGGGGDGDDIAAELVCWRHICCQVIPPASGGSAKYSCNSVYGRRGEKAWHLCLMINASELATWLVEQLLVHDW